jgi:hypothetical protein
MHYVIAAMFILGGLAWSALVFAASSMSDVGNQPIDGSIWFGLFGVIIGLMMIFIPW